MIMARVIIIMHMGTVMNVHNLAATNVPGQKHVWAQSCGVRLYDFM